MSDTSDVTQLCENTHFTRAEAALLLADRSLTGDPADDKWSNHVIVTPDEVVLKRPDTAGSSDIPTAEEIAEATGATVEQIRRDQEAFADNGE